jgi:hypothetical protein
LPDVHLYFLDQDVTVRYYSDELLRLYKINFKINLNQALPAKAKPASPDKVGDQAHIANEPGE